jgi:hypothetical protein
MRGGYRLLTVLSLSLAACGSTANTKLVTVRADPSSLGQSLIAHDSVSIAVYCLRAAGARVGRQMPPTAKQSLYEQRALRALLIEAKTDPHQTYRGAPLRAQLVKLARILEGARCDPSGARLLRELLRSLR